MLNKIKNVLLDHIKSRFQLEKCDIISEKNISGGCINDCVYWNLNGLKLFIKSNSQTNFPAMFEKEKSGIDILDKTKTIRVPKVYFTIDIEGISIIVMEFIESSLKSGLFWNEFATKLAELHKCSNDKFGLDHDNYIGSLVQNNSYKDTWASFFIEERIEPQVKMAYDSKLLLDEDIKLFNILYKNCDQIFPKESPSLLHGDLWSGNFLVDEKGAPAIIDPAIYYGHREMELAFTMLFGGYDASFYQVYDEVFPLSKGFMKRKDIYNVYPLLVHLNLFGSAYLSQIRGILRTFN